MHWTAQPNGGFSTGEPWLPLGDYRARNVAAQREDPGSLLTLTRQVIALKRLQGPYQGLPSPAGCWRYARGGTVVDLDFGRATAAVQEGRG
jgi:alpha-glucosidase